MCNPRLRIGIAPPVIWRQQRVPQAGGNGLLYFGDRRRHRYLYFVARGRYLRFT
jgi:hypothetical protein